MRVRPLVAFLMLAASTAAAQAAPISREDASSRVLSAGFTRVSRAELAPGLWDVWASKDGIPYEVKVNADTGSVIAAMPVEDDD